MEHGLELIQFYPGNRWKSNFYNLLISWKYWKSSFSNFSYPGNIGNLIFPISGYPGHIGNIIFLDFFGIFTKNTRAEISRRMVRFSRRDLSSETDSGPKTKTVPDPNFQLTAATAAATAAATSQQLSHLARALDHHAQGPNIPFGVIPHFD